MPNDLKISELTTKYTKWSENISNGHKIHHLAIQYFNIFHSRAHQNYPIWEFWYANNLTAQNFWSAATPMEHFLGTTFEVRIPNFRMPNFRPSLYRLLKVRMPIWSNGQIFEFHFVEHWTLYNLVCRTFGQSNIWLFKVLVFCQNSNNWRSKFWHSEIWFLKK
jgi:hypothetical protein